MKPSDNSEDPPIVLGNKHGDSYEPSGGPGVGVDGLPSMGLVGLPLPVPNASPDIWVCLRGPCRHYLHMIGTAEMGNPKGTFAEGKEPRQHYHYCRAIPGQYIDMEDDVIYQCNRWDPESTSDHEVTHRDERRLKYLQYHPEHDPKAQPVVKPESRGKK